jgi:hypothetical protein
MKNCDCCGFRTRTKKYEKDWTREEPKPKKMDLCDLCANTYAGNTLQYPRDNADILKAICYVGNSIIEEIRKKK